jgi:hydroxymethylpyrimidine pyrophosphatase-like HAD family hydrolase
MKKIYVFDLDGTTINSNHRVKPCLDAEGNLNLQKYIDEACTEEKIMQDSLLPLATYMQNLIASGETVIILTARHCNNSDYVFLRKHGLRPTIMLSRDRMEHVLGHTLFYKSSDAEYKRAYFEHIFASFNPNEYDYHFFDDHDGILEMAKELPISVVDAKILNQVLELHLLDMYEQGYSDSEAENLDLLEVCTENGLVLA